MKKSYLTLSLLVGCSYLMVSNNAGVTTVQNKDRTGSPVGLTALCNTCHSGASFTTFIDMRMINSLGNPVTVYNPGETYTYEVEVTSTGASAYGFQTVGLKTATNANAGTLTALSSNTKTKVLSGRTYGEHTAKSNPGLFQMTWTAPAAGSGDVKFYATGLGCNSNNSTSGDKFVKGTALLLTENVSTGITEEKKPVFSIYPQPVTTSSLHITSAYNGNTTVVIADMTGKLIYTGNRIFAGGLATDIDVQALQSGTFILLVLDEKGERLYSSTFIKQ